MKNSIAFYLVLAFSLNIAAQSGTKLLTIQDAVLKGRTSLSPKRLQNVSFIPDSKKFSYINNNQINVNQAADGKTIYSLSLRDLNLNLIRSTLDTLSNLSSVDWKNEHTFSIQTKNV